MNSFDFSQYPDEDEEQIIEQPTQNTRKQTGNFDFNAYPDIDTEPKKQEYDDVYKQYKVPDYTPEEVKNMSFEEKYQLMKDMKLEREYLQGAGMGKKALSELTFGFSERIPALKPQEYESGQFVGSLIGSAPYLFGGFGLLHKGLSKIPDIYKWSKTAAQLSGAFGLGAGKEALTEIGKQEEISAGKIGLEGLLFAGMEALSMSAPNAFNWLKDRLSKSEQAKALIEGVVPKDLPAEDMKFFYDEVAPELQNIARQQADQSLKLAEQEAANLYKQDLANARAAHENKEYLFQKAQADYEQRLNDVRKANEIYMKEYELAQQQLEMNKAREQAVNNALDSVAANREAKRTLRAEAEPVDIGLRPVEQPKVSLPEQKALDIITETPIQNSTYAGEETTSAIRATAKSDYQAVQNMYKQAEELSSAVVGEHEELANELRGVIEHYKGKGNLTAAEQEIVKNAQNTLDNLLVFDSEGTATGFKEVNNQFLLDQAKQLRQKMSFDVSEGNKTGIFNPLIDMYESAAELAAKSSGNQQAYEATLQARRAFSDWARLYRNKYVMQFRNLNVDKPKALFESALTIDNFRNIDKILQRTSAGQNLSKQIKRELVSKELNKFFENPRKYNLESFDKALNELSPVLKNNEKNAFRSIYKDARTKISAKPIEKPKEIPEPKLQKEPVPPKRETVVPIPKPREVKPTPAMKEAAKILKMDGQDILKQTNSVKGLKFLKENLQKSSKGKRLLEDVYKRKTRDIIYGKSVEPNFSGEKLYERINNKENYELLSEMIGKDQVDKLLKVSKELGKVNFTKENIKRIAKDLSFIKTLSFAGII